MWWTSSRIKDDADYFASDRFVNNLKDANRALADAGTDVLTVGWWQSPKSFWTIGMSVKVDGDMSACNAACSRS